MRCAWCSRVTGSKPPYGDKYDKEVTHGICDDCLDKYFPHIADKVHSIIEDRGLTKLNT